MSEPEKKKAEKSAKKVKGFISEERDAMKERAKELKANASKEEAENAVLEKIAEMLEPERAMAERLHTLIKANAPSLSPKTWYGMPAYANKDGKIVCFYQSAQKFGTRYGTLGFSDSAKLDDGNLWPTTFALKELTAAVEERISDLVKKAVS